MNATVQEGFTFPDVLTFVEIAVSTFASGDVMPAAHAALDHPHSSASIHGEAYRAALNGDPWRPRA